MKKFCLVLFTMFFVSTSIFAQSDLQVLAVVKYNKSESITVKQLKKKVAGYENQFQRPLSLEERKKVLNALIEEKLIVQAAQKMGIAVTDSMVDQFYLLQLSQLVGGVPVTENDFANLVKEQFGVTMDEFFNQTVGMTKAEFKEQLKNTLIMQQYVMTVKQDEVKKISPTDEDIRIAYESQKSNFVWNDMAKLLIIAVPAGDNRGAAKIKINELRDSLVNKKISAEQIKLQGNNKDSGYIATDGLVQKTAAFAAELDMSMKDFLALFAQDAGFTSDVIESDDGYVFVHIVKKYGAKMLGLSDVILPETTTTVYEYIKNNLTAKMRESYLQESIVEVAEELNTPDNVEMKKSGDALDKLLSWGE